MLFGVRGDWDHLVRGQANGSGTKDGALRDPTDLPAQRLIGKDVYSTTGSER